MADPTRRVVPTGTGYEGGQFRPYAPLPSAGGAFPTPGAPGFPTPGQPGILTARNYSGTNARIPYARTPRFSLELAHFYGLHSNAH